jgi:hypothetical protein
MSANFDVVGRLQLAGYAGTASGILRSRIHPLVPIAAIDVLAVALALGAMNIVGTIVSGYRENPFITALDRVKDDVTAYPAIAIAPAVPKPVSTTLAALMLVPNAELLFAPPMIIGTPFEANTGDTVRFISPADVAASGGSSTNGSAEGEPSSTDIAVIEDPDPPLPTPNITDPPSPPVAKILGIAGVGQARALELAGRVTPPGDQSGRRAPSVAELFG